MQRGCRDPEGSGARVSGRCRSRTGTGDGNSSLPAALFYPCKKHFREESEVLLL